MAQFPSPNNLPVTGPKAMVQLVNLLLTTGVWDIYAYFGDNGDGAGRIRHSVLTDPALPDYGWALAGSTAMLDTAGDWVEITGPGSRGIGLMHGAASNLVWWIVYCGAGAPTGWTGVAGASGVFDACTEIQNVLGAAAAGAALFQADASYRWNIVGYDGTGEWWAVAWQIGTGVPTAYVLFDYVTPDASTDADPYVLGAQSANPIGQTFELDTTTNYAWFGRTGAGTGSWVFCPMVCLGGQGGIRMPQQQRLLVNGITLKDLEFPIWYSRNTSHAPGVQYSKGVSALVAWCMVTRNTPDTLSISAPQDRVVISYTTFKWPTGVVPLS